MSGRRSRVQAARRFFAASDHPVARTARNCRRRVLDASVPAPRVIVRPLLAGFLAIRATCGYLKSKFLCEPCLKAYCTTYGRRLRVGGFLPWISGRGEIHLGDGVQINGKLNVSFATRFSDRPTLRIGDGTALGHNVNFVIGKEITIGRRCMISGAASISDSGGHPVDPESRLAGLPPLPSEVRPVTIEDNVWIATGSVIMPGVTIGEGSVVSVGSVVRRNVPPYSLVMGNPAKVVAPSPARARNRPSSRPPPPWARPRRTPEASPGSDALPGIYTYVR